MTTKIYYTLSSEQEKILTEFFKINKIEASISDFLIDVLKNLAKDTVNIQSKILSTKQLTKEEIDEQKMGYNGKLTKSTKGRDLKVILLSGNTILKGLIIGSQIDNAFNKKNNMPLAESVDDFINNYFHNEINKIETWTIQYNIDQESTESKKITTEEGIAEVKKNFKEKVLAS